MPPRHRITASPHHCVSQSFALPPATKPVSHLPCPLPLRHQSVTVSPCPLHHCITVSPRHCVTMLVSHLPCPLPPHQSVICLAPYHRILHHRITASPHHRVTALVSHLPCPPATKPVSHLPCPLPPSQSVICLAPCHQTSQSFALPPTTM